MLEGGKVQRKMSLAWWVVRPRRCRQSIRIEGPTWQEKRNEYKHGGMSAQSRWANMTDINKPNLRAPRNVGVSQKGRMTCQNK